ncbi:MAG: endonuclease/exonuclease/phosphatase family protein [Bacteroidota bacterium]
MRKLTFIALLPFLLAASCEKDKPLVTGDSNPYFRIMFYNVENLFDTVDDPLTDDSEFLPESQKEWTEVRYHDKLEKIAQVIIDLGGDTLPVLVGFCEIENHGTLDDLLAVSGLAGLDYRIVHRDSPDKRGIDVGLLYRSRYFSLIRSDFIPILFPIDTAVRTRDILYANGILGGKDTIHLFVNHWPSRSSGEVESRPLRLYVAQTIKERVDSILLIDPQAAIVITGDFNDEPEDLSVVTGLQALLTCTNPIREQLYDLTPSIGSEEPGGTYKYKGTWNLLDHMVVSGTLLDTTRTYYVRPGDLKVFSAGYLLEEDKEYMGERPFRTYLGPYYHGGYSDHLPVYLDIHYRK